MAILAFAVLLIVLALSGGDPLVLKPQDVVITGPLGVICLVSVLVRKPLLLTARRMMSARVHGTPSALDDVAERRALSTLTALVGGTLFVHAALLLVLAINLPTATFLSVGKLIGWAVLGAGLLGVLAYRNRSRSAVHG